MTDTRQRFFILPLNLDTVLYTAAREKFTCIRQTAQGKNSLKL